MQNPLRTFFAQTLPTPFFFLYLRLFNISHDMSTLLFASHNKHKIEEIRAMIGRDYDLKGLQDMGFLGEVPEDCDTLEGNAEQKARYAYGLFGVPCFADDTGLEVDALGGAPGVYSARYAGVEGTIAQCSEANMQKLLACLEGVDNRRARFRTIVCFFDGTAPLFFEGRVEGCITTEKHGTGGFGYDPVFMPEESGRTFAEMSLDEKNRISHRARAFARFRQFLETYGK